MHTEDNDKSKLEAAQVRKLELEIRALERVESEEQSVGLSKQEKLKLEVKTLVWQTGRVYRLSQFAVIVSILATLVTIFATTYGIWTSYKKDSETRVKERSDRTDGLYRTAVQRLIQFPAEQKITISDAVFTLRDLEEIVFNNYEEKEKRDRQKHEVGILLAQLISSPDVNLSITRNVELDRKAMDQSTIYRDFLVRNPKYNRDIISKYKNILSGIHDRAPCYKMIPDPKNKEVFIEYECRNGAPEPTFLEYVNLFYAYRSHVAILNRTIDLPSSDEAKSDESRMTQFNELSGEAKSYKTLAFCWFFKATDNNVPLTVEIFGGDADRVSWKWDTECETK